MKTYRAPRRAQRGVSLFGLNVAVIMTTAALVAALPMQIEKIETQRTEIAANQLFTIQDLATTYRSENGVWPGAAAAPACNITAAMTDLVAAGFLNQSLTTSAWGGAITTSCDTAHFNVATNAPNARRAQDAGHLLPAAQIAGNTVTSSGALGSFAGNVRLLHRVAVPGRPELNAMDTALDMGAHAINNASELHVKGSSSFCEDGTADCTVRLADDAAFIDKNTGQVAMSFSSAPVAGAAGTPAGTAAGKGGLHLVKTNPGDTANLIVDGGAYVGSDVRTDSNVIWGNRSALTPDQGGAIELGAGGGNAGTGSPYIDFHFNGSTSDYNVRLQDVDANTLRLTGAGGGSGNLAIAGDAAAGGNMGARDFISSVTLKGQSQDVQTVTIVPPETVVPQPAYCAQLGMLPKIYVAPAAFAEGPVATPIYQVRTFAVANGTASWTVKMSLLTENGVISSPDPTYNSLMVAVKCEIN